MRSEIVLSQVCPIVECPLTLTLLLRLLLTFRAPFYVVEGLLARQAFRVDFVPS